MCGLVGFLGDCGAADAALFEQSDRQNSGHALLRSMTNTLIHRGPDDEGIWFDSVQGIGLGHRRLSILDLSPAGHQPMVSSSGRFVIAFNGEIYNHQLLREKVQGTSGKMQSWRGHSDTETLLACIEAWGLEASLKNSIGMFALALWDRETHTLTLARS